MAARKKPGKPVAKATKRDPTPSQSKEPTQTARHPNTARAGSRRRATRSASVEGKSKSQTLSTSKQPLKAGTDKGNVGKQSQAKKNLAPDLGVIPEESEDEEIVQQIPEEEKYVSPVTSEGPEFAKVLDDNAADVEAARYFVPTTQIVAGFKNNKQKTFCYRNALLVVLLHSTRIFQWLNNRYLPKLDSTGLKRVAYESILVKDKTPAWPDNKKAKKVSQIRYTDVLCELNNLHTEYWRPVSRKTKQTVLDTAMVIFWDYLYEIGELYDSDAGEYHDFPSSWNYTDQQDSTELLNWLLSLARAQREHLVIGREAPDLRPAEQASLESLRDLDIEPLLSFKKTTRRNCVYCNRATIGKRRNAELEQVRVWTFPVQFPEWKKRQPAPKVNLYDALEDNLKSETSDLCCDRDACKKRATKKLEKVKEIDAKFKAEMEDIKDLPPRKKDSAAKACRTRRDEMLNQCLTYENYAGYTWNKLATLPEVLFLAMNRFVKDFNVKEVGVVDIPEELDLVGLFEHRIDLPEETKYRLVGMVTHYGNNTHSGHYTAQTFKEGRWSDFNDDTVSATSLEAILEEQVKRNSHFTPYILMFEKIPVIASNNGGEDNDKGDSTGTDDQGAAADPAANVEPPIPTHALARSIENETTTTLQIAEPDSEPVPGQGQIVVEAVINGTKFKFPTYVLEKHSNFEVSSAQINLILKDSQTKTLLTASRGLEYIVPQSNKRPSPDGDDENPPAKRKKSTPSPKRDSSKTKPAGNPADELSTQIPGLGEGGFSPDSLFDGEPRPSPTPEEKQAQRERQAEFRKQFESSKPIPGLRQKSASPVGKKGKKVVDKRKARVSSVDRSFYPSGSSE